MTDTGESVAAASTGRGEHEPGEQLAIEHVEVKFFEAPLERAVPMSFSSLDARRLCCIEIHAGGHVGYGESWVNYPSWAWRERFATLRYGAAPLLIGRDAKDVAQRFTDLRAALVHIGRQWGAPGPVWQAISGIDMALWDLRSRAANRPLAAVLSASPRAGVPAYASGVGPDHVHALTERALEAGFRAIKVKAGFGRTIDERTVRQARRTGGDDLTIFADANQAWSREEAVAMCGLLADFGVGWCEEPIAGNALADLEMLHDRTGMPLATGENLYGIDQFEQYVGSGAVTQIQPDVSKTGGVSTAMRVAALAEVSGTVLSPHCYTSALTLLTTVHVAAAAPTPGWVEFDIRDNPLRTDVLGAQLTIRDGQAMVPDHPGIGSVDLDRLAPYRIPAPKE